MTLPSLEHLIPHRPPMLLLEEIVGETREGFACRGRVPPALAHGRSASPLLAIEMGAQTAAVFEALARPAGESGGGPPVGYLVSVTAARFAVPRLPTDRALWVEVRPAGGMAPLARYDIRVAVTAESSALVTATIGTYLVSEPVS